jgi:hypothetical protein
MGRKTTENVGEIGKGIDVVVLTRPGEGIQDGRRPATAITPQERPVPPLMLSSALPELCPVPDYAESMALDHRNRLNRFLGHAARDLSWSA